MGTKGREDGRGPPHPTPPRPAPPLPSQLGRGVGWVEVRWAVLGCAGLGQGRAGANSLQIIGND